ncbi:DUF6261 family protein [Flaviaesturariibacter terrae]
MIPAFNLTPLHNGEYISFMGTALDISSDPALPASVRSARGLLENFHNRIKAAHVGGDESALSRERRVFDAERDRHYSSLAQLADVYTRHPDAAKAAAGNLLANRFASYGTISEVILQGLDDETADIDSILRDLETPALASALSLIGGTEWAAALKAAQVKFKEKSQQRNSERSDRNARIPDDIESLRKEANKAYRALVEKINAYNNTDEGAEPWPGIIGKMKTLITDTRHLLAMRRGRAAAQNETPAS